MKRRLLATMVLSCLVPLLAADASATNRQPTGPVRMIAEWEPAAGTLIRWPLRIPMSLVRELAADDRLYTLVEGAGNENDARTTLTSGGVNMDHVEFIQAQVYSEWTRDWGPQCVFDGNGVMGITDPWFDGYPWVPGCAGSAVVGIESPRRGTRGWEEDDVINGVVAEYLELPLHQLPAYCTGGNIMTDGHGRAFSTRQMIDENAPHMSEAQFKQRTQEYLGITDYRILDNPEVHGIQHIDCYAKLLDEETVLVKQVPSWHDEYQCCEDLAAAFATLETCYGRPYDVVRIWCEPYSGQSAAAYTNSLILNGKVLVPTFGLAADDDALDTYRQAMPGYEVVGFDYWSWYDYDALHCRTMAIFDAGMLRVWHRPLEEVVPWASFQVVAAEIDDRSEAGLVDGAQTVRWRRSGEATWNEVALTATAVDSFAAQIPGQTPGTVVEYYLTAADYSGRYETLPRTAPAGFFTYQIDPETTPATPQAGRIQMRVQPNPANPRTAIRFDLPWSGSVTLAVYDLKGRRVATLARGEWPAGPNVLHWSGETDVGAPVMSGTYLVQLKHTAGVRSAKVTLLK